MKHRFRVSRCGNRSRASEENPHDVCVTDRLFPRRAVTCAKGTFLSKMFKNISFGVTLPLFLSV